MRSFIIVMQILFRHNEKASTSGHPVWQIDRHSHRFFLLNSGFFVMSKRNREHCIRPQVCAFFSYSLLLQSTDIYQFCIKRITTAVWDNLTSYNPTPNLTFEEVVDLSWRWLRFLLQAPFLLRLKIASICLNPDNVLLKAPLPPIWDGGFGRQNSPTIPFRGNILVSE